MKLKTILKNILNFSLSLSLVYMPVTFASAQTMSQSDLDKFKAALAAAAKTDPVLKAQLAAGIKAKNAQTTTTNKPATTTIAPKPTTATTTKPATTTTAQTTANINSLTQLNDAFLAAQKKDPTLTKTKFESQLKAAVAEAAKTDPALKAQIADAIKAQNAQAKAATQPAATTQPVKTKMTPEQKAAEIKALKELNNAFTTAKVKDPNLVMEDFIADLSDAIALKAKNDPEFLEEFKQELKAEAAQKALAPKGIEKFTAAQLANFKELDAAYAQAVKKDPTLTKEKYAKDLKNFKAAFDKMPSIQDNLWVSGLYHTGTSGIVDAGDINQLMKNAPSPMELFIQSQNRDNLSKKDKKKLDVLLEAQKLVVDTADNYDELATLVNAGKYDEAFKFADKKGITRVLIQADGLEAIGVEDMTPAQIEKFFVAGGNNFSTAKDEGQLFAGRKWEKNRNMDQRAGQNIRAIGGAGLPDFAWYNSDGKDKGSSWKRSTFISTVVVPVAAAVGAYYLAPVIAGGIASATGTTAATASSIAAGTATTGQIAGYVASNAITSAVITGAVGGDAVDGLVTGTLGSLVAVYAAPVVGTSAPAKAATNAVSNNLSSVATGKGVDLKQSLLGATVSQFTSGISTGIDNLDTFVQNTISSFALNGGHLTGAVTDGFTTTVSSAVINSAETSRIAKENATKESTTTPVAARTPDQIDIDVANAVNGTTLNVDLGSNDMANSLIDTQTAIEETGHIFDMANNQQRIFGAINSDLDNKINAKFETSPVNNVTAQNDKANAAYIEKYESTHDIETEAFGPERTISSINYPVPAVIPAGNSIDVNDYYESVFAPENPFANKGPLASLENKNPEPTVANASSNGIKSGGGVRSTGSRSNAGSYSQTDFRPTVGGFLTEVATNTSNAIGTMMTNASEDFGRTLDYVLNPNDDVTYKDGVELVQMHTKDTIQESATSLLDLFQDPDTGEFSLRATVDNTVASARNTYNEAVDIFTAPDGTVNYENLSIAGGVTTLVTQRGDSANAILDARMVRDKILDGEFLQAGGFAGAFVLDSLATFTKAPAVFGRLFNATIDGEKAVETVALAANASKANPADELVTLYHGGPSGITQIDPQGGSVSLTHQENMLNNTKPGTDEYNAINAGIQAEKGQTFWTTDPTLAAEYAGPNGSVYTTVVKKSELRSADEVLGVPSAKIDVRLDEYVISGSVTPNAEHAVVSNVRNASNNIPSLDIRSITNNSVRLDETLEIAFKNGENGIQSAEIFKYDGANGIATISYRDSDGIRKVKQITDSEILEPHLAQPTPIQITNAFQESAVRGSTKPVTEPTAFATSATVDSSKKGSNTLVRYIKSTSIGKALAPNKALPQAQKISELKPNEFGEGSFISIAWNKYTKDMYFAPSEGAKLADGSDIAVTLSRNGGHADLMKSAGQLKGNYLGGGLVVKSDRVILSPKSVGLNGLPNALLKDGEMSLANQRTIAQQVSNETGMPTQLNGTDELFVPETVITKMTPEEYAKQVSKGRVATALRTVGIGVVATTPSILLGYMLADDDYSPTNSSSGSESLSSSASAEVIREDIVSAMTQGALGAPGIQRFGQIPVIKNANGLYSVELQLDPDARRSTNVLDCRSGACVDSSGKTDYAQTFTHAPDIKSKIWVKILEYQKALSKDLQSRRKILIDRLGI